MARGPGSAGGVASRPPRDMPSLSTHGWTCPSQPPKPLGHAPRPGSALDMSLAALESCWACPLPRTNTGHVPWRAEIPLDMPRGPGQGWTYWHYVHCWGPRLGMSRVGTEVCAHARKACFAELVNPAAHVPPRGPTLDMSTTGPKSCWACSAARARDGHIGNMSITRDQHWACPAEGTGSRRKPRKARCAELVNPAGHVPPRGPRMGMSRSAGRTASPRLPAPSAALSRTSINLRGRIDSRATGQAWARSALV